VIAAPDGTVLNSFPGFWTAETFLQELDFSLGLTKETAAGRRAERMLYLQGQAAKLLKAHPEEAGKRVKDSPLLRRKAALELLALFYHPGALSEGLRIESLLETFAQRSRGRTFV
jgi:hypothetical protein